MHDPSHGDCKALFEDLSAFIDNELPSGRCEDLQRHMADCEACQRYIESLKATRDALRRAGEAQDIDPDEARALLKECLEAFHQRVG